MQETHPVQEALSQDADTQQLRQNICSSRHLLHSSMQNPSGGIPLQTLQGIEPGNVQESFKSYNPIIIYVRNQMKRIEKVI